MKEDIMKGKGPWALKLKHGNAVIAMIIFTQKGIY